MHVTRFHSLLLIGTVVLLAACSSSASPTPNVATTGPSVETSAGASESAMSSEAPSAGASVNVSAAGQGLSTLTSYKATMVLTQGTSTSFNATSIVIRQPTPASSFIETGGAQTFRIVTIGTDIWIDEGSGTFIKNPPGMTAATVAAMTNAFDPGVFLQDLAKNFPLASVPITGVEQKNGVSAAHIHVDSSTPLPAGASPLPSGSTVDLWIATDGNYLVALEAQGLPGSEAPGASGGAGGGLSNFQLEVTNINDASLKVAPPG